MTAPAPDQAAGPEVVAFRVHDMDFCIEIGLVREIRAWTPTTVLPHVPPFVTGVINLRGTVVAVLDLAARLGLGATVPTPRHVIIITALGGMLVGLLADTVADILTLDADMIRALPDQVADRTREFMTGVATLPEGQMLRLLNLDHVVPAAIGG